MANGLTGWILLVVILANVTGFKIFVEENGVEWEERPHESVPVQSPEFQKWIHQHEEKTVQQILEKISDPNDTSQQHEAKLAVARYLVNVTFTAVTKRLENLGRSGLEPEIPEGYQVPQPVFSNVPGVPESIGVTPGTNQNQNFQTYEQTIVFNNPSLPLPLPSSSSSQDAKFPDSSNAQNLEIEMETTTARRPLLERLSVLLPPEAQSLLNRTQGSGGGGLFNFTGGSGLGGLFGPGGPGGLFNLGGNRTEGGGGGLFNLGGGGSEGGGGLFNLGGNNNRTEGGAGGLFNLGGGGSEGGGGGLFNLGGNNNRTEGGAGGLFNLGGGGSEGGGGLFNFGGNRPEGGGGIFNLGGNRPEGGGGLFNFGGGGAEGGAEPNKTEGGGLFNRTSGGPEDFLGFTIPPEGLFNIPTPPPKNDSVRLSQMYLGSQVEKLVSDISKQNISGVVDSTVNIASPATIGVLVNSLLNVVLCNPLDRFYGNCDP